MRIVVHFVYGSGEDVRDHQFFEIPPRHQLQPVGHTFIIKAPFLFELRQKRVRPAYGTGKQLREKGDKEGMIAKVPFRVNFPSVNVDKIPHGLKEIERNARGQQDFQS